MKPTIADIRLAQRILNSQGANLKEDGDFGLKSQAAAIQINGLDLPKNRQLALTIQKAWNGQKIRAFTVKEDAWWGPATADIAERLQHPTGHPIARPDEAGACPMPNLKVRCWTPSDAEMTKRYGVVGGKQSTIDLPYPMRLDWDTATIVTRATVHRTVADSFQAALEEARDHYGLEQIQALGLNRFGGSLNVRKKRGGTTWSAHAWGVAADFWPEANQLRQNHTTARFASDAYDAWFAAWEHAGWMSLGRCFDFDWMHVQKNPD